MSNNQGDASPDVSIIQTSQARSGDDAGGEDCSGSPGTTPAPPLSPLPETADAPPEELAEQPELMTVDPPAPEAEEEQEEAAAAAAADPPAEAKSKAKKSSRASTKRKLSSSSQGTHAKRARPGKRQKKTTAEPPLTVPIVQPVDTDPSVVATPAAHVDPESWSLYGIFDGIVGSTLDYMGWT